MHVAAIALVILLAVEHVYIMVLEMFLWNTPFGRKKFHMTPEKAELTAPMAKNQGLYNGFLAAGLIASLLAPTAAESYHGQIFFCTCIAVAGIYGAATVMKQIFFIQTVPALAALAAVLAAGPAAS